MKHLPELRQLRYFVAVAEHASFTRAARMLHLSQPPLSRQISNLERAVGATLLVRDRSGVRLTDAGNYFLAEARRLLGQLAMAAETTAEIAAGRVGTVRLGFASTALYGELPALVRRARAEQTGIRLELHEMTLTQQVAGIRAGEIDLGFALCAGEERELQRHVIGDESVVACLPDNHPRAARQPRRPLVASALAGETFVSFPRILAPALYDRIARYLEDAGVVFHVGQEAVQMQTIIGLVSSGLGIALVPESMAQLDRPGVRYRRLTPSPPRLETSALWNPQSTNPALAVLLRTIVGA
ncbi:MAG: LysR family transcriptional regulator [Gammaproteobacteria bacterium]